MRQQLFDFATTSPILKAKQSTSSGLNAYNRPAANGNKSTTAPTNITKIVIGSTSVRNPKTTFCIRAKDDSMAAKGIYAGDLLLIDRHRAMAKTSFINKGEINNTSSLLPSTPGVLIATIHGNKSLRYVRGA